jgi:hypothetical protein
MRIKTIAVVLTAVLSAPAVASADVAPAGSTDELRVEVTGRISPHCDLTLAGDPHVNLGDILDHNSGVAARVTTDIPFRMSCNAPFRASMKSKNGGLAFEGAPVSGFSSLVDYIATMNIAGAAALSLTCDSATMKAPTDDMRPLETDGCKAHSDTHGVSAGDGAVQVATKAGGQPLLMGTYSDEIVLSVTPIIGGESSHE